MTRIVTFYSYKGGTGRSMALANVAWILASNGLRVLAIDWDLEAPGLHHYLAPFLPDPELRSYGTRGIIDFFFEYVSAATTPQPQQESGAGGRAKDWYVPYADITQCAIPLRWPSGDPVKFGNGCIDFVPAGRQDPQLYANRVNTFDWRQFYERQSGGAFIDAMKERLSGYDYVLVDSRTGVSDTSGICTVHLPDTIVLCFTLNNQSVKGAARIAASIAAQDPKKPILPVPMRVDPFEKDRLNARREYAHRIFGSFVEALAKTSSVRMDGYWDKIEIPYFASYAYEELLAPFEKYSASVGSLLPAFENLTSYVTNGAVKSLGKAVSEEKRKEVLAEFADTGSSVGVEEKRPAGSLWQAVAATGLWLAIVIFVVMPLLTIWRGRRPSDAFEQLLTYATKNEGHVWEAATALSAIPIEVPGAAELAKRLLARGVPYAVARYPAHSIALRGDGSWLATAGDRMHVIQLPTLEEAAAWNSVPPDGRLQFSPDGTRLVTLGSKATVYDFPTARLLWSRTHPNYPAEKTRALSSGFEMDRNLWAVLSETPDGPLVAEYDMKVNPIDWKLEFPDTTRAYARLRRFAKVLSADGRRVAVREDSEWSVWTLPEQKRLISIPHSGSAGEVAPAFVAQMAILLLASANEVRLFNVSSGKVGVYEVKEKPAVVTLDRVGGVAALAYDDGRIDIVRTGTWERSSGVTSPQGATSVREMQFSDDGRLLAVLYGNSFVYVWRVDKPPHIQPTTEWSMLREQLLHWSGGCVNPEARKVVYNESASEAETRFVDCRNLVEATARRNR